MNQKSSSFLPGLMPVIYMILSFFYILLIIEPVIHFHHLQSPFLLAGDFYGGYIKHPGGISELVANFLLQSYFNNILGSIIFLLTALIIWALVISLLNQIHKSKLNRIWAFIPFTLLIALSNNFNFPFSIVVSVLIVVLLLNVLNKTGKTISGFIITYILSAISIYYISGSGFFLMYTVSAVLFIPNRTWTIKSILIAILFIFSVFIPKLAYQHIFALSPNYEYLYFFPWKPYFLEYKPELVFYTFLLSFPTIFLSVIIFKVVYKRQKLQGYNLETIKTYFGFIIVLIVALLTHRATFNPDAKKIVEADYYCYTNNPEKTAEAATTLLNYNFAANLNYNLVMAKSGRINNDYFYFFQIRGSDALFPDILFSSDLSFICTDYYYDLGYIAEARHWAYESLVNFPYSLRAMKSLVKIHLVTGEYEAAERYLKIMQRGITGQDFVQKYLPYIGDTILANSDQEIMEKRSFIPGEQELDPNIGTRFKELLHANKKNKRAFEYLMLFYLLNADLDSFAGLYAEVENYFDKPVDIYEEAFLIYQEKSENGKNLDIEIRQKTVDRYNHFKQELMKFRGNSPRARAELYPEFGSTYLFYLQLVYPILLEPEYIKQEEMEPYI